MKFKHFAVVVIANLFLSLGMADSGKAPSIEFMGESYLFRLQMPGEYDFTPEGQDDLKAWKDLFTINHYPAIKDGEMLTKVANNVLEIYQNAGAELLAANSIPATETTASEHFMAVAFFRPEYIEATFVRVVLIEGEGYALVRSYREYGESSIEDASGWIEANGPEIEKELMAFDTSTVSAILREMPKPEVAAPVEKAE